MKLLQGIIRKICGAWSGSAFAKGHYTMNNEVTSYKLYCGDVLAGAGNMRLQPVPAEARQRTTMNGYRAPESSIKNRI